MPELSDHPMLPAVAADGFLPGSWVGARSAPGAGGHLDVCSPIDGQVLARVSAADAGQTAAAIGDARDAFRAWREVPAPVRGELVRRIGNVVRARKAEIAELVTLEAGKIREEALGEVQEWIDLCDFAVGLSRQLHGLTMATERPGHRMMEQWHPLGPVGVITAFNFPVAVWAWNAMLAMVCGDSVVWKPSEKTPLCALACQRAVLEAAAGFPDAPEALSSVVVGGVEVGQALAADTRLPLVSATGSVPMGRRVAVVVAERLGRCLLELGGNNAMVITPSADLALALRAIVFAAVGTAGQRCTSLRRLIVHESILDQLEAALRGAYGSLRVGDPREPGTLVGPLIGAAAWDAMQAAIARLPAEGGRLVCGGERVTDGVPAGGFYVRPALARLPADAPLLQEETFAPLLYLVPYADFGDAIRIHNAVPQGLSSAVFTRDVGEAERFLAASGSDCGIANVNIGTSGAEIGGAFGGEKDTGGGRESGSDAWKNYMRRATNTVNYGGELPLAQGIRFDW